MSADVTGDGIRDRANIVRSRCGWFVEVVFNRRRFGVRIPAAYVTSIAFFPLTGNVDKRPGAELFVETDRSGDTITFRPVTFAKRRLRLMQTIPSDKPAFVIGHRSAHGEGLVASVQV